MIDRALPLAWNIVNDSFRCDLCLRYPPYLIAVASLQMACTVKGIDLSQMLAELKVSPSEVAEIIQVGYCSHNVYHRGTTSLSIRANGSNAYFLEFLGN